MITFKILSHIRGSDSQFSYFKKTKLKAPVIGAFRQQGERVLERWVPPKHKFRCAVVARSLFPPLAE